MRLLLTLAWRNLWIHKLRTVLTIISITLGVAVILAVRTANRSTFKSVEALFNEAAGKSSLTVESVVSSHRSQVGFQQNVVQQVWDMPGVTQAVPRLTAWTVYQGKKGPIELAVQGVDPAVDEQVRIYSLVEGAFLSPDSRTYAVVVVDEFAQREGIQVGKDIQLLTPSGLETFRVLAVPLLQFFGSWAGYELESLSPSVADVVQSFCLGVVVTIISVLWPMIQACRLSPMEAVRVRGQEPEGKLIRYSWIVGLVLLALWGASYSIPEISNTPFFLISFVGVTFLLPAGVYLIGNWAHRPLAAVYGYEGSLGSTNLERSRWRTSTTVAVLVVGITMGISTGTVSESLTTTILSWVDSAMSAYLFVSSYTPMSSVWGRRLAAMEGVTVVSPTRILEVQVQDPKELGDLFTARVQAVDTATREQIGDLIYISGQGDPAELWATFVQGGSLLVSTQYAQQYDIRKGDTLHLLRTARGIQEFPVAAVILDASHPSGVVMMTWDDLRRFFRVTDVDMYLLKVNPGVDLDVVRQRIDAQYGRGGHLTVISNADFKKSMQQMVSTAMAAFNVIVLIAFVVAAFSMVNTLTMSIIERTREIGLLRAVGMTRFQIGKMVLAEAVVMGLIGVLFGIVFGGVFSRMVVWWMNYSLGLRVNYVWPILALLTSCVLALVVSQLAALLPALRASRFTVIEALRYE